VWTHDRALRDPARFPHVLLGHQDGRAERPVDLRDRVHEPRDQHGGEPQRGLVEQQEPRPLHERDADGQHLALPGAEGRRQLPPAGHQSREEPVDEPQRHRPVDPDIIEDMRAPRC
jgi:hypothetical protein